MYFKTEHSRFSCIAPLEFRKKILRVVVFLMLLEQKNGSISFCVLSEGQFI